MPTKEQQAKLDRQAFMNMAKKGDAAKNWKEARETKAGEAGGKCKATPGQYTCLITGKPLVPKRGKRKGKPCIELTATIQNHPEFSDESLRSTTDLTSDQSVEFLVSDLKKILPALEEQIAAADDPSELVDVLDAMNNDPPLVACTFDFDNSGKYLNFRIDELVEGGEGSGEESTEETVDEGEESIEDEGGDGEESIEEESVEEAPAYVPNLRDLVTYSHGGKPQSCMVVTRNMSKQTVSLKNEKTQATYREIGWDKLTLRKS